MKPKPQAWVHIEFMASSAKCDQCAAFTESGHAVGWSYSEAGGKTPKQRLCMPCLGLLLTALIVGLQPRAPGARHPERI